jgi:hypothetical protein
MTESNLNKHTINFTDEDIETCYKNLFIKLIVSRDHPDIEQQALELAKQLIEQDKS